MWIDYFLAHHGVRGQKWGVKNGPPYPLLKLSGQKSRGNGPDHDIYVRKGTKVKHISDRKDIDLRNEPIHISYKEWDNLVYKGAYAVGKMKFGGSKSIFEHTYKAVEELVSPSRKKRVDIFIELLKDNKVWVTKDLEAIERDNRAAGISRKSSNTPFSRMDEKQLRKEGYRTFVSGFEEREKYPSVQQYIDKIKKKSYNALVDDNNVKIYNDAKSPLLVLDAKKSLTEEGRGRQLSEKEIDSALSEVNKRLKKKNKRIEY